ncbi:hypothetical protein VTJ49DRAFT_2935 [Mycothermus thermophilus]|uniref:Uncharacterized protein n=1 Tax=Humicola insolens TaxID=85995 RepID=A0ABR3V8Q6_HUMIN
METSAPKRRRTSPRTAVAVHPDQQPSTASHAPRRVGSSPTRPSFASPTRASLERHNPEILRRRESQPRRLRSSPDAAPAASRPTTPDSTVSLTMAMHTQLDIRSGASDAIPSVPDHSGASILRSPARRLGGLTPSRPPPRPLPPPAPEVDDELLKVITGRVATRNLGVLPEVVVPEPELPPTPERPDPVVSTPPSGIHNTPSRRAKRNRSSPLKQPPARPPGLPSKKSAAAVTAEEPKAPSPPAPTTADLRGLAPPDPDADKKKLRDSLLAEIRELEHDLDIAARENERIRQARLARREPSRPSNADEILRILTRHALPPDAAKPDHQPTPIESWLTSALNPIAFLPFSKPNSQPNLPKDSSPDLPPPISHHPLPLSASEALPYLQVFTPLVFTAHVSPLPQSESEDGRRLLQQHSITASSATPRGLFSARIDMTVDTRTMAVTILSVPRLDPAAEPELRPFIERVVGRGDCYNGKTGSREDGKTLLRNSALHNNVGVLTWAMGLWLRVAVQRARVWRVLEREVGSGEEAVREMVARQRERKRRVAAELRRRGRGKRRRLLLGDRTEATRDGGDGGEGDDDEGESQDGNGGLSEDGSVKPEKTETAADLLPFMGRTRMDLEIPVLAAATRTTGSRGGKGRRGEEGNGADKDVSALRVQWRIVFDWTGEARSEIGVLVGVPGKCEFFATSRFRGSPLTCFCYVQGINTTNVAGWLVFPNCLTSSSAPARTRWMRSGRLCVCWRGRRGHESRNGEGRSQMPLVLRYGLDLGVGPGWETSGTGRRDCLGILGERSWMIPTEGDAFLACLCHLYPARGKFGQNPATGCLSA